MRRAVFVVLVGVCLPRGGSERCPRVVAKGTKSGPVSVTTPAGTATSSTSFTVL